VRRAPSEGPSLIGNTIKFGAYGAAFGSTLGVFEGAWKDPHPTKPLRAVGEMAASHAATAALVAAVFGATDAALETVRGHSPANQVVAGCVAGSMIGFQTHNLTRAALGCGVFGTIQAVGAIGMWSPGAEH